MSPEQKTVVTAPPLEGRIGLLTDPSSPDAVMQRGLKQAPPDQWDAPQMIEFGVLTGDIFRRKLAGRFPQERRVTIVVGELTGKLLYQAARDAGVDTSRLPHIHIRDEAILFGFERGTEALVEGSPSLQTARKRGASSPHVDTEAAFEARGGKRDEKIPKRGGWNFGAAPWEIDKRRKRYRKRKKI